jgi:hypothetical protein
LTTWAGPKRSELLAREAEADGRRLADGLEHDLLPRLQADLRELAELKTGLEAAARQVDLAESLTVTISGELKNSLIMQIQGLFLKWDLLRYPRKVMAAPYVFLRDKVLSPMGVMNKAPGGLRGLDQEIDRLFEANRETMVAVIHEYNRRAAALTAGTDVGRRLVDDPAFESLPWKPDHVRERYHQVRSELEAWVESQARELVKGLNLGEKMTFYLSQAVSLGLFISIQVQTGGGFSFFDGLLDSVLAPILSKITGHALSRDKVKAFEEEAGRLHLEGCRRMLTDQAQAYIDRVDRVEADLAGAGALAEATRDFKKALDGWT